MPYLRQQGGRQFYRWYFYDPAQSLERQSKGIAVRVLRDSLFGGEIGFAVVKDMSIGGSGLLVPTLDKVPDKFWVMYDNDIKVKAMVRYRKKVNDKLEFLGLQWLGKDYAIRLRLLRRLRRQAFMQKHDHFRLVANASR
jgi:hypothetical protein